MQRRDELAQVPPQKIIGHFHGEKLMLLICLARGRQSFCAAPIEPDCQRRECGFVIVDGDPAVAFTIQANFDAAGMKTFTPIKFLAYRKVVPLEAQARAGYAAVQMPPTVTDRMPCRAFGERRRDAKFGFVVDFDLTLSGSRHGDNVPSCARRANIFLPKVLNCSTQLTANK
jgi:hypothetical protein